YAKVELPATPVGLTSVFVDGLGSAAPGLPTSPLPLSPPPPAVTLTLSKVDVLSVLVATLQTTTPASALLLMLSVVLPIVLQLLRSEERRVGKVWRVRRSPYH